MVEIRDDRDRVIRKGARVYVVPRPSSMIPGYELPGFRGIVKEVVSDFWDNVTVHITEFGTLHHRSARPEHCRVQYGKSAESQAHQIEEGSNCNDVRSRNSTAPARVKRKGCA